jgi:hypothetical protein
VSWRTARSTGSGRSPPSWSRPGPTWWYLRGAYVHYGLGNFVFYSRGGVTAQTGVLLLTMRGRAVTRVRWAPAVISGGIPIPLQGAAADRAEAAWRALRGCTGLSANP